MSSVAGHASLIGASFGQYEVQRLIGRGAMGTVYLAQDATLKRPVALKVLLGHLARNPVLVRRFHREAQATAHLRHSNIVRIYSAGVQGGTPYIAMEYVEGEPLDQFLRRAGALEWQKALHIGGQTAEALAAAHASGLIHRDVKPANIMLDLQGRVRLADFGIAQLNAELEDGPFEESFLGTPRYMSPEQCANRGVSAATDLFSLGIVLYEMIAGRQPFQGETAVALIQCITHDTPPRLNKLIPQVPDDVARLVDHLLEKRPEGRPGCAAEVVERIAALQAENGGRSALPDALTAYIREQAKPRSLPSTPLPPATPRPRGSKGHGSKGWRAGRDRLVKLAAAAGILVVAALLPPAFAYLKGHYAEAGALPEVPAIFYAQHDGVMTVHVANENFHIADIGWPGDASHLVVSLKGRAGTRLAGATGAIGVRVMDRQAFSLAAPHAPAFSDAAAGAAAVRLLALDPETGAAGKQPALFGMHRTHDEKFALSAYSVDSGAPLASWKLPVQAVAPTPWTPAALTVAMHPRRAALCLVDPTEHGVDRLVQYSLPRGGATVGGETLARGIGLIPESIGYSPAGDALVFQQETGPQARSLFYLSLRAEDAPRLIYQGALEPITSFSPDGRRVACTAGDGELHLIDLPTGAVRNSGPGRVGRRGWHPSGAYLVVAAPAREGMQLWAVETASPHRKQQLTRVVPGVRSGPEMTADGARAAAVVDGDGVPQVVVVELENGVFAGSTRGDGSVVRR
jgi:serine/threonine protein kinase